MNGSSSDDDDDDDGNGDDDILNHVGDFQGRHETHTLLLPLQ